MKHGHRVGGGGHRGRQLDHPDRCHADLVDGRQVDGVAGSVADRDRHPGGPVGSRPPAL